MDKKNSFGEKLEAFFAGKGFYIVLFLCVAVIGVSAWSMLAGTETDVEPGDQLSQTIGSEDEEDEGSIPVGSMDYPVLNQSPLPTPDSHVSAPAEPDDSSGALGEAPEENEEVSTPPAEAPVQSTETSASYFIWPVSGKVENPWSMAALTYSTTMRDWRTHDGIDIAAEKGAQVKAAAGGIVEKVYNDDMFGSTVIIDHGGGLKSVYSNLAATPAVSQGQTVAIGQVIGSVGDTALCEAGEVSHLHFAMSLDGKSVDPEEYMP